MARKEKRTAKEQVSDEEGDVEQDSVEEVEQKKKAQKSKRSTVDISSNSGDSAKKSVVPVADDGKSAEQAMSSEPGSDPASTVKAVKDVTNVKKKRSVEAHMRRREKEKLKKKQKKEKAKA